MYTHYGRVGAIPTYRVYQLSDIRYVLCVCLGGR